jgi:hypothetical protein
MKALQYMGASLLDTLALTPATYLFSIIIIIIIIIGGHAVALWLRHYATS